jgi:uncharacterized protein
VTSRLTPFRQFVLKIDSRCDLACDHCYMYEAADQGWRRQPIVMSRDTAAAVGRRIAEHAHAHGLDSVRVVLHGGEPLLAGVERTREIIEALREPVLALPDPPRIGLGIHTNAVRLDERFCRLFEEYGVKVGVSLDGDRAANDRHRTFANGKSSYAQTATALELLRTPRYRHLYAGILCTVDIANDPVSVYRALAAQEPPRIDLLLPHATWDSPPPRPDGIARPSTTLDPAYAKWLLAIYRVWTEEGRPFGIRLFDSIHSTLHGGPPLTESLGLAPSDLLVIETDGSIEQADSLKVAFDGAAATGLRVQDHPLAAAWEHAQVMVRQNGLAGLSEQCVACPVLTSCGGGLFAHRYRASAGGPADPAAAFRNPSVYCADLYALVTSIRSTEYGGMASSTHLTVSAEHFEQLATGFGDAAAIDALAQAQASINRSLLAAVGQAAAVADPTAAQAWELLRTLDERQPAAVAKAISHPFFRPWAFQSIDDPAGTDLSELIGYALAAASSAKQSAELRMPPGVSSVYVPGIGRIAVVDGVAGVGEGGEPEHLLTKARYVAAGAHASRVLLEDLDDARDCFHLTPAPRLTDDEFAAWSTRYEAAWRLLDEQFPEYVGALHTGLRALVPLAGAEDGNATSGTARQAFGALGMALPEEPEVLALLLIHEFQHVKLGAMLDLFDLYDASDTRLYYAPWRPDPRPVEGLLQGTYAHVAVVDYWRRRAEHGDHDAEAHFARWRGQTWEALEQLESSGSLTDLGERFVGGLKRTLRPWLTIPVSAAALAEAARVGDAHRAAFTTARPVFDH